MKAAVIHGAGKITRDTIDWANVGAAKHCEGVLWEGYGKNAVDRVR